MNLPAEEKPQVQLICERLIDKFAARLEKDSTLAIPRETQEEFLRVKEERDREREIETDLHREREIYRNRAAQVWREGTAERLRTQSFLFPQKEGGDIGLQSDGSPREETRDGKRRRINAGDSDDEFEDANWDGVGQPQLRLLQISRPAESSRALTAERSLQWSLIIRNGIVKAGLIV
ncbi:hypothetical protein, conserved [Eimeria brunetti]|uniref:Uncharacterized protein n=1 Tax=Eimeria brunetti TaxID=51314 RepID=U6LC49_9EIME|nr:hypothetical protein, conserved [Eimeria brunetti]